MKKLAPFLAPLIMMPLTALATPVFDGITQERDIGYEKILSATFTNVCGSASFGKKFSTRDGEIVLILRVDSEPCELDEKPATVKYMFGLSPSKLTEEARARGVKSTWPEFWVEYDGTIHRACASCGPR